MKSITLENPSFRYLEKSFGEWLDVQSYSASTVYNLPLHVREILGYLEGQGRNTKRNKRRNRQALYYYNRKGKYH